MPALVVMAPPFAATLMPSTAAMPPAPMSTPVAADAVTLPTAVRPVKPSAAPAVRPMSPPLATVPRLIAPVLVSERDLLAVISPSVMAPAWPAVLASTERLRTVMSPSVTVPAAPTVTVTSLRLAAVEPVVSAGPLAAVPMLPVAVSVMPRRASAS